MSQLTDESKKYQELAYVEWWDAVADANWEATEDAEAHPCRTMGFVVAENDKAICIASTVSFDESNAKIHIPKGWIEKIKRFEVKRLLRENRRRRRIVELDDDLTTLSAGLTD